MFKKFITLSVVVLIALVFCSVPAMAVDLIADGGSVDTAIDIGEVTVSYGGDCMYVTITTDDPWLFGETHVAVSKDNCVDIPQTKKGNARPGKFPYISGECISLEAEELEPGDYVCVAAQAEVTNPEELIPIYDPAGVLIDEVPREESAWGEGDGLPGSDWSMCFCFYIPE